MALPVHTHPDGLLDTKDVAFGLGPLARRKFQAIDFAQLFRPLREDLRSGYLGSFDSCGNRSHGRGRLTVGGKSDMSSFQGHSWKDENKLCCLSRQRHATPQARKGL